MNSLEMRLSLQALFLAYHLSCQAQGDKGYEFLAGRAWDRYVRRIKKFDTGLPAPVGYPVSGYYYRYGHKKYGERI